METASKSSRAVRASVDLAPRYRTPASFDFVEGRCIDLSEGGMFIAAKLPCESGTLLKFECTVDGNDSAVKGVARVVWRRTGDGDRDRPSGMGLKFVKLEPGSPEVITQLVANAKEHGKTAPEAPLPAHVRVTESFPALEAVSVPVQPSSVPPANSAISSAPVPQLASPPSAAAQREQATTHALTPKPTASTPAPALAAHAAKPVARPAANSGTPIWIALALGAGLLAWLLLRAH
jgi:uncharacterized protein (TIGR02266 family)